MAPGDGIEDALIEATELLAREGGDPESIWHPDFGWVLLHGNPTENTKAFAEWLKSKDLI